jgi:hypothetical protein
MIARVFAVSVGVLVAAAGCGPKHGGGGDDDGGSGAYTSIDVLPPNATITYTGTPATIGYSAVGHLADGTTQPIDPADVVFSLDADGAQLGTIDSASATFTATGAAAGKGAVQATVGAVTGATSVMVVVHTTQLGSGVPPDAGSDFPDPLPAGGAAAELQTIDYPLAGAVMPSSVKAPDVMWEGAAAAGDLVRVRWTAGAATLDTILAVADPTTFTFDAQPADADWQTLITSAQGEPITVEVDHWDATNGPTAGSAVSVNVVPADVVGAIYYWDLSQGQMQRIDENGRALAIPNPPVSVNGSAEAGDQCVACHAISRDGKYLSAELWGGGDQGAVFDLTNPAVTMSVAGSPAYAPTVAPVTPSSYHTLFTTFSPDDSRLVINNGLALDMIDPLTGASVMQTGTPLTSLTNMAHPSWSPDGSLIAVVGNISYNGAAAPWAVDYTAGDLQVIPVTGPDAFAAPTTLVAQGTATGPAGEAFTAPSWPTFPPDSSVVAFAAGVNSRGRNTNGATPPVEVQYPGALFYVPRAGGAAVRLDTACTSGVNCFLPNFSPFDQDGYYWMVFYSTRDYGNAQAGTKGTARRQMWITAIDKTKLAAGQDASSVPYWLPEQDHTTENMSAFWSLAPPIQ